MSSSSSTTTTHRPGTGARRWTSTRPRASPSSTTCGRTAGARGRRNRAAAGPTRADAGAPAWRSVADVDDDPGRIVAGGHLERAGLVEGDDAGGVAPAVAGPAGLLDPPGPRRGPRRHARYGGVSGGP